MAQRCLARGAGWNSIRISHRQPPVTQQARKRKALVDRHLRPRCDRGDQHQSVGEKGRSCLWLNQAFLGHIIHPSLVSGDKKIGGSARLYLPRHRRRTREGPPRPGTPLPPPTPSPPPPGPLQPPP